MEAFGNSVGLREYECLLFDLDDTLYPMSSGLNLACRKKIEEFMLHRLHIEENQVPRMCLELYREHGTTMAGLKKLGYEFDNDEFHAYVHGKLPYDVLKPDPLLRNLLLSMPQRKIIFTNSDRAHAAQVLKRLGLEDCFEGLVSFETLNPPPTEPAIDYCMNEMDDDDDEDHDEDDGKQDVETKTTPNSNQSGVLKFICPILCKPCVEAFEAAIKIANIRPDKTLFFDDSARNIASARLAGLRTVIVGSSTLVPGADYALSSIHNMKEALPDIWKGKETHLQEQMIQPKPIETIVRA